MARATLVLYRLTPSVSYSVVWVGVGCGSQQLLSLKPTTVLVVLLLGLWLLLRCDKNIKKICSPLLGMIHEVE